jgi:hypothetical protein
VFVSVTLFRLRSLASEPSHPDHEHALPFGAHAGYLSIYKPDQLAAEHSYLTFYAPALSRLPGVRRQLVGRVFTPDGAHPTFSHVSTIFWEDRAAWEAAMQPGASERLGIPPIAEWAESIETFGGELDEVGPEGSDAPNGVLAIRLFNLKSGEAAADGERYYAEVFAPQVRKLGGVRRYLRGPVVSLRSRAPRLGRISVIDCVSWGAMQEAVNPPLPPGMSPLDNWAEDAEVYVTEYEEIPRE